MYICEKQLNLWETRTKRTSFEKVSKLLVENLSQSDENVLTGCAAKPLQNTSKTKGFTKGKKSKNSEHFMNM